MQQRYSNTRCLRNKKRKKQQEQHIRYRAAAAAALAAICMYIKLTSRLIRRRSNHHRWSYICLHWKKKSLNLRRPGQRDSSLSVHLLRSVHDYVSDLYVFIRTNGRLDQDDKTNEKSTRCRETTRARSRPELAGSGGVSTVKHDQQSAHREMCYGYIVYGYKELHPLGLALLP